MTIEHAVNLLCNRLAVYKGDMAIHAVVACCSSEYVRRLIASNILLLYFTCTLTLAAGSDELGEDVQGGDADDGELEDDWGLDNE